MDIHIDGLEDLGAKLAGLGDGEIDAALKRGILKALLTVEASERSLAARDSGEMAQGVHHEMLPAAKGVAGRTYNSVEHAVYNEFGTGQRGEASPNNNPNVKPKYSADWPGMAAQPFMYPGFKQAESQVKQTIQDEINRVLRSKG